MRKAAGAPPRPSAKPLADAPQRQPSTALECTRICLDLQGYCGWCPYLNKW